MGAVPVALPDKDLATANVGGLETTYARIEELDPAAQKKNQYLNETDHRIFLTTILINKEYFESLPKKYQEAIRVAARTAAKLEREDSIRDGDVAKNEYAQKGFQVVSMTPPEMLRFKQASEPIYKKFEPMFGADLIDQLRNH